MMAQASLLGDVKDCRLLRDATCKVMGTEIVAVANCITASREWLLMLACESAHASFYHGKAATTPE